MSTPEEEQQKNRDVAVSFLYFVTVFLISIGIGCFFGIGFGFLTGGLFTGLLLIYGLIEEKIKG